LESLVKEAVANHPDLKAAAARVAQAAAMARAMGAAKRPQLSASASGNRRQANFIGFPDFGAFGGGTEQAAERSELLRTLSESFGTSLDLSWEVDVWGRLRAEESEALGEWEAAEEQYRAARASLAAQVAKAWFALREAEKQRELAEDMLGVFRSTEGIIEERFAGGQVEDGGTGAQLRLARAEVAAAREQVAWREDQKQTARRQLEVLLGRYPGNALRLPSDLPVLPHRPPAGLPSGLLLRRPDVLAAERRFAARGQGVKAAQRAFFPRLALTAGAGSSSEALEDVLQSEFGVWNLAGNVVQPILSGGRLIEGKRLAEAEERQALAELQTAVLKALLEVETALGAEDLLARREAALEEALRLAEEADAAARADYRDGVGSIMTMLETQSRMLQLASQRWSLRRLRLDNRVNLHLALGGDYLRT
jgi:NodT family efflux transporter outer membrane factor (OMF) lipoprotein